MRTALIVAGMAIIAIIATPAAAWTYYLERDLGIRGFERLCRYSNDEVYSVNSIDLCPMSIDDSPPGFGQGIGFKAGEYQDGLTKVCVYDVLGQQKAIRIDNFELCPLSYDF